MPVDPNRESWKPGMPWEKALDDMDYVKEIAKELGGEERVKRHHERGFYTVRELSLIHI